MKKIVSVFLIAALICSLVGCGMQNDQSATRTITDSAGDQVEVPEKVETVINLVAFGCQAMVGLDLGDYLVGVNEEAVESPWMEEMYPRIKEIEKYNWEPSAESLLKANADVVLVENAEFARELRSKGITAVTFSYFSIDEMKATIRMLGELLGGDAVNKCENYINYLNDNIKFVEDRLADKLTERESLYYINGVSNKGLYKTTGKGSTNWACAELSYTDFATAPLIESPANRVDSEAIIAADPQNIIIGGKYQHVLYNELMSAPEWKNNTAVRNGNVFKVPMGISAWNRYGIEIAIMIPWTSAVVYPEYFEYDILQETIRFYKEFAGYELTEEQAQLILDGLMPNGEQEIAG